MPVRRVLLAGALGALVLVIAPAAGLAGGSPTPPAFAAGVVRAGPGPDPIYRNRSYTPAERAADLVARMTLAEKSSQMVSSVAPAIPRLGIKAWGWWNEANHGIADLQLTPGYTSQAINTTSYPDDLALGSSWDPSLMYLQASAIGDEAREVAPENFLDLDFFAPTVNLSRDPRWGRNDETFSEDPLLTAAVASQYVDGLQGQTPQGRPLPQGGGYLRAIATLKHYAANNSENNRMNGSSNMNEATLREYYTSQFAQIIAASHPGGIMSAFNELNGTPAPANVHLIRTLARQTFGFGGYFTSDCDAVDDIVSGHDWRPPGYSRPASETEARALADAAGEDLNCNLPYVPLDYQNTLPAATEEGIPTPTDTYNVQDMDASLVRLFTARIELGEFDNVNAQPWVKRARAELGGVHWVNSNANDAITETPARLGLDRYVADRTLVLLKNDPVHEVGGGVGPLLPIHVPTSGPFKVAVVGYFANNMYLGGYSSYQAPAGAAKEVTPYAGIKAAIQAIDPSAQVDYYPGFTGGNTAAGLTIIDQNAVNAAAGYNYVIAVVGTDWTTSGEGRDRPNLDLPGAQGQLIDELQAKNPNTVAVLETVGAVNLGSFAGPLPALLWSSYNGQVQGQALADVLLGDYDPSGHLPFTWYQSDSELPSIDDYRIKPGPGTPGRTYMYFSGPVSYPFGYGLSYTSFRVSNLHLSTLHLTPNGTLTASVQVTNTGTLPGEDLLQLYVGKAHRTASEPIKRLEAFQQVQLAPGQTKTITLTFKALNLALWNGSANRCTVPDGVYDVQLGDSAQDILLQRYITIGGRLPETPSTVTASPAMPGDATRGIQTRVMFPVGTTIDPRLTVAMNDQSLYGYIRAGHSRPLPAGARVSYSSDRPSVVSVAGGTIRTVSNGAATVTATVTYDGASASGQFVVRSLSELDSISLVLPANGKAKTKAKRRKGARKPRKPPTTTIPLPGFEPDTYTYEVIVPPGQRPPRIAATTADRLAHVRVLQAAGAPGEARISVTGPDRISFAYAVHFARPALSQDFTGTELGPQWTWIRPDASAEQVGGGSLQIAAQQGDLSGATGPGRNILVQPALGNWTIATRMTLSSPPSLATEQAGIIAYQDDQNYLKLDWEYTSAGPALVETVEDNLSGSPVAQVLASVPTTGRLGSTVFLRMVKLGPRYSTYYSTDGRSWIPIYDTGAALAEVKVGLFAFAGRASTSALKASFGYFHVRNQGPVNLGSLH